ncbi:bifunctional oligoribonuclease/PAP phosphatase NrnA [bacterium]|nr:bifunctional oligoribonuclease/PAP phosphatase NrnA [bacterium]
MNTPALISIAAALRQHQRFLLASHHRPDGDAIGSQLALAIALRSLGKDVTAWNEDPVPAKYEFLPGRELISQPAAAPQSFDAVVALDTSTWSRLGTAADRIASRQILINIDHHLSNDQFGDLNLIDSSAPATGQIVYHLLRQAELTLTRDIATCLYTAIATDTGSFTFPNTTAESLRVAAALVETGVDVGKLSRHVYESYPYARLQLVRLALADLRLWEDQRIATCWVTNEMYQDTGAKREDTEGLIDFARSIDGVIVAILFEEQPQPQLVRISLRSKHPGIDVNAIARHFGGGGHRAAAGARITGSPADVQSRVIESVGAALRAAKL